MLEMSNSFAFSSPSKELPLDEIDNENVFAISAGGLSGYSFERVKSSYSSVCTDEEREELAEAWGNYKDSPVWDEGAIRLESVDAGNKCKISEISFYDLLVTNIIRNDFMNFRDWCSAASATSCLKTLDKMKQVYIGIRPDSFTDILQCGLSNAVAVSVLLYSVNDDLLLVKRSKDVAIGQNLLGVSITGSMNHKDFICPNPVVAATMREAKEELGIDLDPTRIHVSGIAAGKRKLQPAFLVTAVVDGTFENLLAVRPNCDEISKVLKLGQSIFDTSNKNLTEIAKYQLMSDPRIIK